MQMTAADVAFMKGEANAKPGDTADLCLQRAEQSGYILPGSVRDAFMAGFLNAVVNKSK